MCKNCQLKPVYEFTNKRKLCSDCFVKYFQKKVLYTIRKFQLIQPNEVVGYSAKNNFNDKVLECALKMFAGKAPIELVILPTKKKIDKIAISSTIDLEAEHIVNTFVKENVKKLNVEPIEGKVIKPLYLFLDEEVLLYAKIKKLNFKQSEKKKNEISKFINELEMKHPEIKRAIVNGYLGINS